MKSKETLEEKISRVVKEDVELVSYDPQWKEEFLKERDFLLQNFSNEIRRVEHFGSTAIEGLCAKPIVDMLIEVVSLEEAKSVIAPKLEELGYDYFWRSSFGNDGPPFYAWFIKRDDQGKRTHHLHMVEKDFDHWERLCFRDYLCEFPLKAKEYGELKLRLSKEFPQDRIAYTQAKGEFICRITQEAKLYYSHQK